MAQRPWRIGLTGGIGSGKSTVAAMLAEAGAEVVDADAVSRACTGAGGAAMAAIAAQFGPNFVTPDGALNRECMRQRVFADPGAKAALEAIVHPLVKRALQAQYERAQAPVVVFDVPLLVESAHWRAQLDEVWVVDCPEALQLARVEARSGWPRATIEAAMRAQATRLQRLSAADRVLFNGAIGLPELQRQVVQLLGPLAA